MTQSLELTKFKSLTTVERLSVAAIPPSTLAFCLYLKHPSTPPNPRGQKLCICCSFQQIWFCPRCQRSLWRRGCSVLHTHNPGFALPSCCGSLLLICGPQPSPTTGTSSRIWILFCSLLYSWYQTDNQYLLANWSNSETGLAQRYILYLGTLH